FATFGISGENITLPTGRQESGAVRNLYQLYQIANWVHGMHSVRFGGQFIAAREALAGTGAGGVRPSFPDVRWFVEGQLLTVDVELDFLANSRLPGDLVKGPIMPPNRRRRPRYADTAGFIEDTWKANRRLTITPGFRWEYFGTPSSSGHEAVLDANFYPGEGSGYYQRFANVAFM